MKLTMLGTGHAVVTKCYNTCFVLNEDDHYLLVDGGGGNTLLNQMIDASIDWRKIKEIFVTHQHIDHLLGIIWMIRLITSDMMMGKMDHDVYIYGHDEVINILRTMSEQLLMKKQYDCIDHKLHLIVVKDREERIVMNKKVTFFDIHSTKTKQYGFCMEYAKHKKLTCLGDEPYSEYAKEYVTDCDWLMHEAFCLHSQADIFHPYEKHHSTVKDACVLAKQLNVQNIILYHTEDINIEHRKELYLEEGRQYFDGNIYIPDDLEVLELR